MFASRLKEKYSSWSLVKISLLIISWVGRVVPSEADIEMIVKRWPFLFAVSAFIGKKSEETTQPFGPGVPIMFVEVALNFTGQRLQKLTDLMRTKDGLSLKF